MKKIFTLLTMALMCAGLYAQTTPTIVYVGNGAFPEGTPQDNSIEMYGSFGTHQLYYTPRGAWETNPDAETFDELCQLTEDDTFGFRYADGTKVLAEEVEGEWVPVVKRVGDYWGESWNPEAKSLALYSNDERRWNYLKYQWIDAPAKEETKEITWDNDFCYYVECYYDIFESEFHNTYNSKDGITVAYGGANDDDDDRLYENHLYLYTSSSVLTFTSTAGNFKKIEIYFTENDGPAPDGWTLDEENSKIVWEGDDASVTMARGSGDPIDLKVDHIVFTVVDDSSDAVDMVEAAETRNDTAQGRKFFRNGRLVIEKDGKAYTAAGAEIK